MRRIAVQLMVSATLVTACGVSTAPRPTRDERASLRQLIDSLIDAPETRQARWGVLVVDPVSGDTLYSHDAGKLFVPASNMKLLTAAVALDVLGPEYRFPTPILARGPVRSGTLDGDLLVVGRGDPSVSDNFAGDAMAPLRAIADSLWARGLRRVRGRVIAYGNAFPDANAGTGWSWDDFEEPYGALIDELLFNEGFSEIRVVAGAAPGTRASSTTRPALTSPALRVDVTTVARAGTDTVPRIRVAKDTTRGEVVVGGTIPVGMTDTVYATHSDPAAAYVAALREALHDRGITVGDSTTAADVPTDTLFVRRSATLAEILPFFLKPSQNQVGEMLFKSVALARTDTGSASVARRAVMERLRSWGARADGAVVMDGSGLSRMDLVSPETIVHVLDAMRRSPTFGVYRDALPVAGFDGTLRSRMRGTRAEANVRGKTGTLSNVRSLSGYVTTAGGRMLLFSILCNNYVVPTSAITRVQDSIAARLASLRDASPVARQIRDAAVAGGGRR
jgi:D-alanyl-D-alanine carboxypeptidase/D-alanyl-D-alanine-endopeptidase (penicillin-binding protein 4)